jgi:hypothetical protein
MTNALKIGHGHEMVIVARGKTAAAQPWYYTLDRRWSAEPAVAQLYASASEAYKRAARLTPPAGRVATVEGIACAAFGHV